MELLTAAAELEKGREDDWERPAGSFPLGEQWEITQERAGRWFVYGSPGTRADTALFRRSGTLDGSELALLLFDLSCYEGLLNRYERRHGPKPPPLAEYLRPGREHWGEFARLARELATYG